LTWWRERANRLFPAVVGWTLAAGPLLSGSTAMRGGEWYPVAVAGGPAGSGSLLAIMPVFNMIFDARPRGWIPHLTVEVSLSYGRVGAYRNDGDTDLDDDGMPASRDGEEFRDPGGGTRRRMGGIGGTGGLNRIF
jgi:hypothetical protein